MMCHFYEVSPRFLDLVTGFGNKKASSDQHFIGCYGRLNPGEKTLGSEPQRSFGTKDGFLLLKQRLNG